ncbi:hypothetical protein [Streptomyces sp. SID3343]|uniref:hypothetical protein n=1 Tax=Streptomyces sp. SID3343 TaxID=2690260 RepID=UPI00136AE3D9|nr:hypothetical protein [Streptomyces sp. SID3343]MYW03376.1 hypothetical protein [Streptomyces sp. SID3343]MYW06218.1 hypothetical protein [Streptomyces sp. SID3343]
MSIEYDQIMHRSTASGSIVIRSFDEQRDDRVAKLLMGTGFRWSPDESAFSLREGLSFQEERDLASTAVAALSAGHVLLLVDSELRDLPIHVQQPLDTNLGLPHVAHQVSLRPHPHAQAALVETLLDDDYGALSGIEFLVLTLRERVEDHPGPERNSIDSALHSAATHLAAAIQDLDLAAHHLAQWNPPKAKPAPTADFHLAAYALRATAARTTSAATSRATALPNPAETVARPSPPARTRR